MLTVIGALPLGAINVALDGSITAIVPLLAQFDLMLTGSFGLGTLGASLSLTAPSLALFPAERRARTLEPHCGT